MHHHVDVEQLGVSCSGRLHHGASNPTRFDYETHMVVSLLFPLREADQDGSALAPAAEHMMNYHMNFTAKSIQTILSTVGWLKAAPVS